MPKLERRSGEGYAEEEIRRGLVEVALCGGNTRLAARRLEAENWPVPRETLKTWTATHRDRYEELRRELVPRINEKIAQDCEEIATLAAEAERETLERYREALATVDGRELAGALRNVSVSKGINLDKTATLRGRPTQVIEHRRSPAELYRGLERLGLVVNSTAEEAPDEEPPELPSAA